MKVLLMYPDKDLILKEDSIFNEAILIQDLELKTVFNAMALQDKFLFDVIKKTMLFEPISKENIMYRQSILKDCIAHPKVIREIYHLPIDIEKEKRKQWIGIYSKQPSTILFDSVQALAIYFRSFKKLRNIMDKNSISFQSLGFKRFFTMIEEEFNDEYLNEVEKLISELGFQNGLLISANLGTGIEIINFILRKENIITVPWYRQIFTTNEVKYTYNLEPHDNNGAQALSDLRNRVVNEIANVVAQSAEHIDNFFKHLQLELAFYIGCLNLHKQLTSLKESITFPEVKPIGELNHSFSGLYDLSLTLTMKKKIVSNDFDLQDHSLIIITGANQGGKSTFLRSIGIAQLMMQCGMFCPAESYSSNICSNVFTHFKREEDSQMESGKLDEELERMSDIIGHITKNSLILFNESFASTNEREGSEIAKQIIEALLNNQIKLFFVTHLYSFAESYFNNKNRHTLFLRAMRNSDGTRPYKLQFGEPLDTSYGKDLYFDLFENEKNQLHDELAKNTFKVEERGK